MKGNISLGDLARHPLSLATAFVTAVGALLHLKLLGAAAGALWASIGTLFTGVSIFAFTVAPEVGLSSGQLQLVQGVALFLATAYGVKMLFRFADRFTDKLE